MDLKFDRLLEHIACIAEEVPPAAIRTLANKLIGKEGSNLRGRLSMLGSTASTKALFETLDQYWMAAPELSPEALGWTLIGSQRSTELVRKAFSIDIVLTGPKTNIVPLRRTEQVLIEVIESAKNSIFVVSFVTYKAHNVVAALISAINRGAKVRMLLETKSESGGKLSFDEIEKLKSEIPKAEILCWPLENRDQEGTNWGTLHAKCAIADSHTALITSANLTGHAMEINMELGVLIRGGTEPNRIQKHFEELIRRGVLKILE
jgi:cardiolipin synthase A/B